MPIETAANSVQLPPLDNPNERAALGAELQAVLHGLIDLSLIGKQLHWSVVGAAAHGVHLFLDELVEQWRERSLLDHVVVWELGSRVAAVSERIRLRLAPVGAADLVTQEVLTRVVGMLEKQQWLLRVQLGEKA